MSDGAEFKRLAERCLAQANKATSAQERRSHVELAMVWSRLAEQEDELGRTEGCADELSAEAEKKR